MDWGQLVRFHLPKSHVAYSMKLIINQMDRKLVKSQNQSGREIKKEVVACEDCGTAALESLCACRSILALDAQITDYVLFCCHDIDHVTVTYLGRSSRWLPTL